MEWVDNATLKRMKFFESGTSTPSASSLRQPKPQDQILEEFKILVSRMNNLSARLTTMETNVDEIYKRVNDTPKRKKKVVVEKSSSDEVL